MRPPVPVDLLQRAQAMHEKHLAQEKGRMQSFGKVMPIMHAKAFGSQMVMVGNRIYKAPENSTFTNFTFSHGLHLMGDEWLDEQNDLPPEERHPLHVLHYQANEFTGRQPVRPEGYVTVVPNGPLKFCVRFYHDLYTVDHNNELRPELLHRLRNKEQFQGAAHELFVEATCLRAGFSIVREHFSGPMPKNAGSGNREHPRHSPTYS